MLALGGIVAVAVGAHLHSEAIGRGGEEARAAREAIGPFIVLRSLIAERGTRRSPRKGATLAIGRTVRGGVCRVPMGAPGEGRHVLVAGSTGAGKTVTQAAIVHAHIDAGMAALVADPKPDPRLLSTVEASAAAAGVPFRLWSPSGPLVYNPLAIGDPDEVADKALAAHEFSEPHYEMAVRRLLGLATATMKATASWPPTLSGLVEAMHPERLDALADRADGGLAEQVHAYVDGLDSRGRADLRGGRDRLAILAESGSAAASIRPVGKGRYSISAAPSRGERSSTSRWTRTATRSPPGASPRRWSWTWPRWPPVSRETGRPRSS